MLIRPIVRCLLCREELALNLEPMALGDLDLRAKKMHTCNPVIPQVQGIAIVVGYRRVDDPAPLVVDRAARREAR